VSLRLNKAYPPIPPFQTDPNGALVQALSSLSGNQPGTVAFGTEAHFMQTLGMETVVWGPGRIDQAHQPNEYLSKDQLAPATNTLRAVIERFCLA
jgi:acetylornithine deacetylase